MTKLVGNDEGWRLEAGGWRLEAGGIRMVTEDHSSCAEQNHLRENIGESCEREESRALRF